MPENLKRLLQPSFLGITGPDLRRGRWSYDPDGRLLVYDADQPLSFFVPVDECRTASGRLAWIAHVAERLWSSRDVGDFVRALNDFNGLREPAAVSASLPFASITS